MIHPSLHKHPSLLQLASLNLEVFNLHILFCSQKMSGNIMQIETVEAIHFHRFSVSRVLFVTIGPWPQHTFSDDVNGAKDTIFHVFFSIEEWQPMVQ